MYMLPQEIEVRYIIPAIRRDLAIEFVRGLGITYKSAGEILGITKVAVFQYLSGKRASKIKLHPKVSIEVKKSAKRIIERKSYAVKEIKYLLKFIQKKKLHCEVCGKIIDGKLHNCKQVIPMYEEN